MKIMNVELSNVSAVGAAAGQGSEAAIMFGSKLVQTWNDLQRKQRTRSKNTTADAPAFS